MMVSLYGVKLSVFITKTECVYCAVRSGSVYITEINHYVSKIGRWLHGRDIPWPEKINPFTICDLPYVSEVKLHLFEIKGGSSGFNNPNFRTFH